MPGKGTVPEPKNADLGNRLPTPQGLACVPRVSAHIQGVTTFHTEAAGIPCNTGARHPEDSWATQDPWSRSAPRQPRDSLGVTHPTGQAAENYRQVPVPSDLVGAIVGKAGAAVKELVAQVGMPIRVRSNPGTLENPTAVIGPCSPSGNSVSFLNTEEQVVRTRIAELRNAPWESRAVPVGGLLAPECARSPRRRHDRSSSGGLVTKTCHPPRTPPKELNALDGDELWDGEDDHLEEAYEPYPTSWHGLDQLAWEAAVAAGYEDEEDEGGGEWQGWDGEWQEEDHPGEGDWQEGAGQGDGDELEGGGDWQGGEGQEDGDGQDGDGYEPHEGGEEEEEEEEEEEAEIQEEEEEDHNEDEEEEGWGEGGEEEGEGWEGEGWGGDQEE